VEPTVEGMPSLELSRKPSFSSLSIVEPTFKGMSSLELSRESSFLYRFPSWNPTVDRMPPST
jgi:hypothetical protein